MAILRIRHETVYRYRSPVAFGEHRMLLRPRESLDQRTLDYRLDIDPAPTTLTWSEDVSGNAVAIASFGRRATELAVTATMRIEQKLFDEGAVRLPGHARNCPFSYGAEEMPDLARFIERQQPDPDHSVDRWARQLLAEAGQDTWRFLIGMNDAIRHDFAYLRREAPGIQAAAQTLRVGSGTCRDFAALMSEAVRSLGLAARFVSGYLYVPHEEGRARHVGGNTHAWLQVFLPGAGWVDFDPTSGWVGNAGLVRAATVRDPSHAAPLAGSFIGFPSDYLGMSVTVDVSAEGSSAVAAA
jgi:transglutaminase-like putative cysteine protease